MSATTMKVITLHQPYASLISLGFKTIETRSWYTSYRGPIAIHASMRWTSREQGDWRQVAAFLRRNGLDPVGLASEPPRGLIVAIADLADCELMRAKPGRNARIGYALDREIGGLDRTFGDLAPGRFAWFLDDVRPIDTLVSWKGVQGLTDLPIALAERLPIIAANDAEHRRVHAAREGATR